jgi:hypothetical protein
MKFLFVQVLLGIGVLFSSLSFAQDLNFSEYRKFLMNGSKTSGGKMAIQTTCTTTTGQTYRIGETGYDTCLTALKNQHEMKQLTGGKDSSQPGNTTGATTTIHIGN